MMKSTNKAESPALRAGIYARKSNDDSDKAAGDTSCARQIAHARDYIARKGWRLAGDEHIYIDDDISGVEFKNRPALLRLLNHLNEIDVIVMSEQSRLGREQSHMPIALAKIVSRGVRIFFYLNDAELRYDTAVDVFMVNAVAFANEMERELASQRARDAALKRAKEGRNFGGRTYGYDNAWRLKDGTEHLAPPGEPKPVGAQTVYHINATEARVLVGIYTMYRDGHGAKAITYALNGEPAQAAELRRYFGARRPPPPRGAAAYWSPNTVHDFLRNPRYLGCIPYGSTRKMLDRAAGTTRRVKGEEILTPAPQLRIVPEPLAAAVRKRVERMRGLYLRTTDGRLHGRPESGRASKYLLSGLVRCEGCGSSMIVSSQGVGHGSGRRLVPCYVCNYRSNRGHNACANGARPVVARLDAEVLAALERFALTPGIVRAAARRAVELIKARAAANTDRPAAARRELAKAERERGNLVAAIAAGRSKPDALIVAIAEREKHIAALHRELAQLESPPLLDQLSDKRLERQLTERAAYWREALHGDPALGRQALRALLAGPIWFAPEAGGGYRLRGATRLGALWPEEEAKEPALSGRPHGYSNPGYRRERAHVTAVISTSCT